MAFSFANIFGSGGGIHHGGGNSMQVPTANPAQQINNPNGAQGTSTPSPVNGAGTAQQVETNKPADSQVDELQKFWQTPKDAEGKPLQPAADPLSQQMFNFDPSKVQEATGKLDFTRGIDPEKAKAALTGDVAAFLEVLNQVGRAGFTAATLNTGTLLNDGFGRHSQRLEQALPQKFRQLQINTSKPEHPMLSDPAVAPLMRALKLVAAQNNPDAAPEDVQSMAEQYFIGVAKKLSSTDGSGKPTGTSETADTTDWVSYVGLGR